MKKPAPLTKSRACRGTKWGLLLLLLFTVTLLRPSPAPAACCNVNTDPICPINTSYSPCLENPLVHWCQNTASECPPLTPTPTTPPVGPPFASPTPTPSSCGQIGLSCCSGTCPGNPSLICRPSDNVCILPGSFRCLWLGGAGGSCQVNSSCGSGTVSNSAYCSQFGDAGSCNGAASQTCTLPSAGGGSFTGFCPGGTSGIQTALGCLDITGKQTISQILGWAVVVGGGIAFLLIVYAGFQMATAAGDPKRVKASQELLTAALGGLVLIVISVVLLNFIGVRVLGLDPLGFKSTP